MKYLTGYFYYFEDNWHIIYIYDIICTFVWQRSATEQEWPWPPSISFRVKAEILSKAYKVLHGLTPFLTFSSPSTLPLAHHIRPTSPLLCFQCTKWVPSLRFLYCLFPPLGHSTCSYSLINCLTFFKTLLKCHFLNKTYPDHPIKNCNSHP